MRGREQAREAVVRAEQQPTHGAHGGASVANGRPETRLSGTVGNCRANDHADVRLVKEALRLLGHYDEGLEPHGYIVRELDEAVRGYQRDRGLRCDGWRRPGARPKARCGLS